MSRKRVLLPQPLLHPSGEDLLAAEVELVRGPLDAEQRARVLPTVHGVYGWASAEDIAAAPQLEVAASGGSGVDWIDIAAATERGVLVVNAAGAQHTAVAEHTVGLLLALVKRIAVSDRLMRGERRFPSRREYVGDGWPLGAPRELRGRRLGVVGFGHIGREVARTLRAGFGMDTLAYDPYAAPDPVDETTWCTDLDEVFASAHVVSLHLPLSEETRGLVDARRLALLAPTACLVNLSRGGVVDEAPLVDALRCGRLAGAALDVFADEPLPADSPFYDLPNVVLTPHIGGWTAESLPRLAQTTARQLLAALRGERPTNLVNPEAWPAFRRRHGLEDR